MPEAFQVGNLIIHNSTICSVYNNVNNIHKRKRISVHHKSLMPVFQPTITVVNSLLAYANSYEDSVLKSVFKDFWFTNPNNHRFGSKKTTKIWRLKISPKFIQVSIICLKNCIYFPIWIDDYNYLRLCSCTISKKKIYKRVEQNLN